MHLPCCDGSCFLRIHVKNIFIGNAESNISKVLYKSICLQQKKNQTKKVICDCPLLIYQST